MFGQQWNEGDPNELRRPGYTYLDTAGQKYDKLHSTFEDEMKIYGVDPAQHPDTPARVVAKSSGIYIPSARILPSSASNEGLRMKTY